MKQYKAKNGNMQFMQSIKTLERAINSDSGIGYCLACGKKAHNVEPDARKYTCASCGKEKVYGAEELAMMGLCY